MKQTIKINASSLILSRCVLQWHRVIVQGYKSKVEGASLRYGVAAHEFIDSMMKSKGRMDIAYVNALKEFDKPKIDKAPFLSDRNHFIGLCNSLWVSYILKDKSFEILEIKSKCWWCGGQRWNGENALTSQEACSHCQGTGTRLQPATEVTFSIPYYEDEHFIILLEGTIDKIGKIVGGCYALGDWKFTSSYKVDEYLSEYETAAPIRFYAFALKLMHRMFPDSVLGQIGKTNIGMFIDGVFLKSKVMECTWQRSDVFQFTDADFDEFKVLLDAAIQKLLTAIRNNTWQQKEGFLNGNCNNANKYGKCSFYFPCKVNNPQISQMMLARDFVQREYDPLHHNL